MPAYYKNTVAELRQICETRGIEHDDLTKPRLIAVLREADVRDGYDEEDLEDVGVEGADDEIQLGEHLHVAVGSGSDTSVDAGQDTAGAEGETESITALRLKLALRDRYLAMKDKDLALREAEREARREELRLKERVWQIAKERMAMQAGSQSTRGTNVQLPIPSEIYKVLPRMSSNDTDVLTFFVHVNVVSRQRMLIDRDGMNLCPLGYLT